MNTIIYYKTGAYGTFIEWVLTYLTDPALDDTLPFRDNGNSHSFTGNYLLPNKALMDTYIANKFPDGMPNFSRTHPEDYSIEDLIEKELQIVNVWFTKQSAFWIFNNSQVKLDPEKMSELEIYYHKKYDPEPWEFMKRKNEELFRYILHVDDQREPANSTGYGYEGVKTEQDLSKWQLREVLSYWDFSEFRKQYFNPPGPAENTINIQLESLKDNFTETILNLVNALGYTPIKERADMLDSIGKLWKDHQTEINKDQIVSNYLKKTISGEEYNVSNLNFFEEAWIQRELRALGYEIKCQDLDHFPESTVEMNKLIYDNSTDTERA